LTRPSPTTRSPARTPTAAPGADNFEGTPVITAIDSHAITAGGAAVAVSHGSVKLNGDGTLTFTPTAGFSGQTTYSYTVTSGGVTETATETIQVGANQAPRPPRQHRQRHRRHFGGRALGGSDVDGTIAGITITAGPSAAQGQLMYDADGNPARPTCPCRSIPC
jgi:hypothetical protein